jgi:hypothetical protein
MLVGRVCTIRAVASNTGMLVTKYSILDCVIICIGMFIGRVCTIRVVANNTGFI